ncbi:hypothetical protein GIB67_042328 [Kingdonia uniflora]|uniref:Cytochrome P450 n=1 Tax=Kingdonia uniflora TaxID=39325 RepID=A0A7J7LE64_9MAGN|nr:hypothetical protein GIB67_042327 [Kingdonia uniflora]KAF6140915.1 hypothetical protein GIB67_042328 [Kingdonia uniflora]
MVELLYAQQWLKGQGEGLFNNLTLSLLFLFFFSVLFWSKFNGVSSTKLNLPPSPPKLPLIGHLHKFHPFFHRTCRDLSNKYGPIMLLQLGQAPFLVVSSPDTAKKVMMTQDTEFADRPPTSAAKVMMRGYTNVNFAPYGDYWRQGKKLFGDGLLNPQRVQSFRHVREEEAALMMEKISRYCSLQTPIEDLSDLFRAFISKTSLRCAVTYTSQDGHRLADMYHDVMTIMGTFSFEDYFPSFGYWIDVLTGFRWKLKSICQENDIYWEQVIDEHISRSTHNGDKKDLLDLLLQKEYNLTRANIKAMITDLFLGSDDAATTLKWAFAELINSPNAMKKVQEEVRRVVGIKSKVQEEDIHQMEYLKCVLKETLRLHPAGPTLVPRYNSKGAIVNGYDIPPNTTVLVNVWAIMRDPKVWENAEEFIPERFTNNMDIKSPDHTFVPFGTGKRSCPGISFGLAVLEIFLANLLFHFDWKLPGDLKELDMTEWQGFALQMKAPLRIIPTPHSD